VKASLPGDFPVNQRECSTDAPLEGGPSPAGGSTVLDTILASGRLRWRDDTGVGTRRGPLLLISGSKDALIPERDTGSLERHYRRASPDQVSDRQVFPGRGHSLVVDARWRDVAYYCLDWLTRQDL
jgi:alpha-beta hydrolase superfamily lysophospholipase